MKKCYIRKRLERNCACGEIGRHAILRGWFPMDVLVRVQSCAQVRSREIYIPRDLFALG
jgi:hypothetical protein